MSAPLIWIFVPLFIGVALWVFRTYRMAVVLAATISCLLLALLAWYFPIGALIKLGPFNGEISPIFSILGRRLVINNGDRFLLTFLYGIGAFWFFGEGVLKKNAAFVPLGMVIIPLAIAALAVEPFLYAALIVEIIVLISIPLLLPAGTRVGHGILRYLIFQTFGMMLILFAGWAAGQVEANPADTALTMQALVFLGLGFAFWLAIFPFYTWIPLLFSEVFPFQAGFMLNFLPLVVLLLGLDFINAFAWLRGFADFQQVFRLVGIIMVATGGIWSAFQKNVSRIIGYAIIVEIGFSLLALSLRSHIGYQVYVSMFMPRIIALAVWSLALSGLDVETYDYENLTGLVRRKPISSIAMIAASFTLSGLPLLAVFPLRQVLLENLAQQSLSVVVWALVGSIGLMMASIRTMLTLITPTQREWQWSENWQHVVLLLIGVLALILIGLTPVWLLDSMKDLLNAFVNL